MKKRGTVKLYKRRFEDSMTYKLQEISMLKQEISFSAILIMGMPLRCKLYEFLVDFCGRDCLVPSVLFELSGILIHLAVIIRDKKQLKELKKSLVKTLAKIEPRYVSTEEEKKQLQKRL